jgi:hypothetical protein
MLLAWFAAALAVVLVGNLLFVKFTVKHQPVAPEYLFE